LLELLLGDNELCLGILKLLVKKLAAAACFSDGKV
jgi:hypothetical protein